MERGWMRHASAPVAQWRDETFMEAGCVNIFRS